MRIQVCQRRRLNLWQKNFVGKYGNPTDFDFRMNENGTFTYDEFKIMAMKFVWKSTDIEYKTTRINQQGEEIETFEPYRTTKSGKVIPPKEYNKDNRKTTVLTKDVYIKQNGW